MRTEIDSSLNVQVGGGHYKGLAYQPVSFAVDMDLNFIQGNIVKYVSRYKNKNGIEDLKKVAHYSQIGIELNPVNFCPFSRVEERVKLFVMMNNFSDAVGEIITAACYQDWLRVISGIRCLYDQE